MAALLNSLQMGFKTLAIQKRSSEVWDVLSSVKSEFETFGTALEQAQTRINQAGNALESWWACAHVRSSESCAASPRCRKQRRRRSVGGMSEAGRAAGRPGRYFAAALRFARTTGHTGIDVSAGGGQKRAAKERGEYHVRTVSVFWEERRMLARIREEAVRKAGAQAPRDEVFPSDGAPVLVLRGGKVVPAVMSWDFPGMQGGRNVINAGPRRPRERPMFRDGVAARRCVVPATGFMNGTRINADIFSVCPPRTELYSGAVRRVRGGAVRILTTRGQCQRGPVPPYAAGAARTEVRPTAWRMNKPRAACCTKRRRSWSGGRRTASCGW